MTVGSNLRLPRYLQMTASQPALDPVTPSAAALIGTAFVQDDAEAARAQWRQVAERLRQPRSERLRGMRGPT